MSSIWEIVRRPGMKRPVIYKIITKSSAMLTLSLLWVRYVSPLGQSVKIGFAFMVMGLVCICLAWFSYLSLDGVKFHYFHEKVRRSKNKKQKSRSIADFIDERIVSFDELESDEQMACRFISNLLAGFLFVLSSGAAYLLL